MTLTSENNRPWPGGGVESFSEGDEPPEENKPRLTADDIREVYESDITDYDWHRTWVYEAMADALNSILEGREKK